MNRSGVSPGSRSLAYLPVWIAFAILAAFLLSSRGIITKQYTHDLYVVFDGIWRIYSGQRVFEDFHSPIGIAYFLPYMLLRHLEPFTLLTMLHGNLMVAAGLLALATLTLRRRLSPALFFLATFGIVAVAISPRGADTGVTGFSHLAPYNRWCEAATMLAAPLLLLTRYDVANPLNRNRDLDVTAAIVIGVLALFLLNIKITFFLCLVGLAFIGLVFRRVSPKTVLLAALIFGMVSLGLELGMQLYRQYFADIRMAGDATIEVYGKLPLHNRRSGALMTLAYLTLAVVLLLLAFPASPLRPWLRRHSTLLLMVGGSLLLSAVTNFQNHTQAEVPLMGAVLLVAAESLRRESAIFSSRSVRKALFFVAVLIGAATIPLKEAAAVVLHGVLSHTDRVCPLPALRGTAGDKLLFTRWTLSPPGSPVVANCADVRIDSDTFPLITNPEELRYPDGPRIEVGRLTNAFGLLQGRLTRRQTVMALDFANPFSAFTGTPSPRGGLLWWDFGRNYAMRNRPDPEVLLRSSDYVLESRFDPPLELHGAHAWQVYGPSVTRDFRPVAEGRLWRLWERRGNDETPRK